MTKKTLINNIVSIMNVKNLSSTTSLPEASGLTHEQLQATINEMRKAGMSNREIARAFNLGSRTVDKYAKLESLAV